MNQAVHFALIGLYHAVAIFLMFAVGERHRSKPAVLLITLTVMAPIILIAYAGIPLWFKLGSLGTYVRPVATYGVVFLILWQVFKLDRQRAALYVAGLVGIAWLSPYVFMMINVLFAMGSNAEETRLARFLVLAGILIPVLAWMLSTRFDSVRVRAAIRCFGIAVVWAPVIVVGHGIGIMPMGMVWGLSFLGTPNPLYLIQGLVSIVIFGLVLLPVYHFARRRFRTS